MDPSGTYVQCDAKAIGSGAEGAQSSLGEIYHKDITLKEATKHALTILKQVIYTREFCDILNRMASWWWLRYAYIFTIYCFE